MKKGSLHLYLLYICNKKPPKGGYKNWWRGEDLNFRPSGYEPDELPTALSCKSVI